MATPTSATSVEGGLSASLGAGELEDQVSQGLGDHGQGGQEDTVHHPWVACRVVQEKSQSLMGRDLEVSLAPFLIQCHSVFLVFASLCLQAASAVSASLSQAALSPPPEHTWLLTSDNTTTAAPLSPTLLPAAPSSPLALFLPLLPHHAALRFT